MSLQDRDLMAPAQPVAACDHGAHAVLVGLDIGISTTKIAHQIGLDGEPVVHRLPSRALPINNSQLLAIGGGVRPFDSTVLVHQQPWMAAINSPFLGHNHSQDDKHFEESPEWLAHARAALARLEQPRISELVVGIPLTHLLIPGRRELASTRLLGMHPLHDGGGIEIERVTVVPSSMGAQILWDIQFRVCSGRIIDVDAPVLVIDCGHRTVSWMLIRGHAIQRHLSAESAGAGARLQRRARALLRKQLKQKVSVARMEWRCRQANRWMDLGKATINLDAYLQEASLSIVPRAIEALKASLKPHKDSLHSIVLTGGLSKLFAPAITVAFPHALIACLADPTTANARGLLQIARRLHSPETD
ncbi:MAG: ParM/StbA family protein [Xanthomonadales bacterium]|nr:ParM/StbA family protein [Xanthomonadales bacterium]